MSQYWLNLVVYNQGNMCFSTKERHVAALHPNIERFVDIHILGQSGTCITVSETKEVLEVR